MTAKAPGDIHRGILHQSMPESHTTLGISVLVSIAGFMVGNTKGKQYSVPNHESTSVHSPNISIHKREADMIICSRNRVQCDKDCCQYVTDNNCCSGQHSRIPTFN